MRGHWDIEALHHVRDVTFGEDVGKIWTGHGPENMATLRNLGHGRLRDVRHDGAVTLAVGLG